MSNITDYRLQITEIYQISGIRQATTSPVCQMLPVKFLSNDTCYLLSVTEGSF